MDSNDNEDVDDDTTVKVVRVPIYNTQSWSSANNYGPQCSQHGGFCLFCYEIGMTNQAAEEADNTDSTPVSIHDDRPTIIDESNCVKRLELIIDTLVAEKQERSIIVSHVYNIYKRKIQSKTKYRNRETGMVIHRPEWTKESIDRHLTYCGKWPEIFDSTIDGTIQAIMDNQGKYMCDGTTGMVIPDRVKEWIASGEFLIKWKLCKQKCSLLTSSAKKHASVAKTVLKER